MKNQYTLFETEAQEVKLAQIVQDRDNNNYAVYEIYRHQNGTDYKLINTETYEMCVTKSIIPFDEYIGTGFYYDFDNLQSMPFEELGRLLTKADNIELQEEINESLHFELIDYSQKAVALFGDTKSIKDLLSAMGGKFNPRLTYHDKKQAGWIFSVSKRNELNTILNLK